MTELKPPSNQFLFADKSVLLLQTSQGMGHAKQLQLLRPDWKNQSFHGGLLRRRRAGRGQRPLSLREPLHAVFKIEKSRLACGGLRSPKNFKLTQHIIAKYAAKFFVKIEQISIQGDHVHLLLRANRRTHFHHFFRVTTGQISQRFARVGLLKTKTVTDTPAARKLWKLRPFTRVVRGWRAYRTIRNYIQLNEKEARHEIKYQKLRLKGLSVDDWDKLWK